MRYKSLLNFPYGTRYRFLPRVGVAQSEVELELASFMSVCLFVCLNSKCVSGSSYTVENASNHALVPRSPDMEPVLAAVGSATVAVLSQSSSIERPFLAMRRGHVVCNNYALYMLLYKQCRGFYCCSKRVVNARSVFQEHHLVLYS